MQKRKLIVLLLLLLSWSLPAQEALKAVGGNTIWVTKSGEEYMDRLLQDIKAAKSTIEIEYYWFDTDATGQTMKEALMAKARQGLRVRVILDNLITPFALESYYEEMKESGVELHYAHPFEKMNPFQAVGSIFGPRDHRKMVFIDGEIAYTGGMNFYDEAIHVWRDTQVRIKGPACTQMWEFFSQSWQKLAGEILDPAAYPVPDGEVLAEAFATSGKAQLDTTYIALLNKAQKYFYLQTPYFAPPKELINAFKDAAIRGVDVRLLVPNKSDWGFMNEMTREYSIELMRAGVGIYVFMGAYDHTKIFITDDALASCSTINMDYRSLRTNWENGFYFYDPQSIQLFKDLFTEEANESRLLGPDAQPAKGFRKGYRSVLKKLSPLF